MKLTIQRATVDDAKQLSEMGYASYRHHFGHLWESQTELAAFLEQEYAAGDSRQPDAAGHLLAHCQRTDTSRFRKILNPADHRARGAVGYAPA
ncbi:hypothetical protein ENT52713_42350 [Enterobacter sp. 200527-13]|nr:hypothetical protein ENT52713_42350 [Enterobacter sp. 200527-13]